MAEYPIQPVPFSDVIPERGFWYNRIETNRDVTVPHVLKQCETTGRILNFIRASTPEPGPWCSDYPYDDSDVYKCIEGAAATLHTGENPALDDLLDHWIEHIRRAQDDDGYLYPFAKFEFDKDARGRSRAWWYGPGRWDKVHLHSHELYNVGHLYEAAAAHFEATGKRSLLDVALKNADLVSRTFGPHPDQRKSIPGHQEVELGLMRLFRVTGETKYLETAAFFLSSRGDPRFGLEGGAYWQNHKPVKEQREAVGHAVRAAYMYSAMADLGMLTDDPAYFTALDALWEDVVSSKLYLTGGIGSTGEGEGFQAAFVLPNDTAYCETCAAIANIFWNHRMFLWHGDSNYIDVLERSLYNNMLSGISLSGDAFFYPNPLESAGDYERTTWFGCACCPSNVVRFIPRVPGYAYAVRNENVYVNLFLAGRAHMRVGSTRVKLLQETDYPWSGSIRLAIRPESPVDISIRIRIPGWARKAPVPSALYTYDRESNDPVSIRMNGMPVSWETEKGYAVLRRRWKEGDTIDIDFPMPTQAVRADPRIETDRGRIAFERGPIVYAIEGIDGPYSVTPDTEFETVMDPALLGGVVTLRGDALSSGSRFPIEAIPYFAWAHRGPVPMRVWHKTSDGTE